MISSHTIQSFDHTISQMSYEHEIISNPNTYLYVSRSKGNNSIDDILETLSNYHHTLVKDFLNHQPLRLHKMFSSLIRSNQFLVDHSQPPCILHYIQNIPHKPQRVKFGNEPKHRFTYIKHHGDLKSKDHLHYSH